MKEKYLTKDMIGRNVEIPTNPQRIISLVPSITELLHYLKLNNRVVGITKFCIKPSDWHNVKTRVGGTKNINLDKIKQLNPDLIIANKEENTKKDIELISKIFPVWISDINSYEDAIVGIKNIANICNKRKEGNLLINNIENKKNNYKFKKNNKNKKVLYLIWKKPYMAVGKNTYINDIINKLGYQNCYNQKRYKEISIDNIIELSPDFLFLSSEPYPFKENDLIELQEKLPNTKCKLVDGELFSWYGSRLLYTFTNKYS